MSIDVIVPFLKQIFEGFFEWVPNDTETWQKYDTCEVFGSCHHSAEKINKLNYMYSWPLKFKMEPEHDVMVSTK